MPYFYLDLELKGNVPDYKIKHAATNADSDSYVPGDVVEIWDHVFRWDADCITSSKMGEWRFRGDKLADPAMKVILGSAGDSSASTDQFVRLEAAVSTARMGDPVHTLWASLDSIDQTSFKYNRAQIERGQAVFWRYAPHLLASLLQFSLSAGFSSPRISRVLNVGSYLVPPMSSTADGEAPRITAVSNDRTYMRLMETTQFVVDCMGRGALEVGAIGWKSCIRVRLLHAAMRRRILEKVRSDWKTNSYAPYDEARDGVPISQEDYTATLTAFATAPLVSLRKMGIAPSQQECEDYTALWKVIGYYIGKNRTWGACLANNIGIDEDILHEHFSNWHQSTRMFGSTILHSFAGESVPPPPTYFPFETIVPKQDRVMHVKLKRVNDDPYLAPATIPVIFSLCNRWPLPWTLLDHCAAARNLIGPTLSDWLSVPKTSWSEWFKLHIGYAIVNIPPQFAQVYRSGWDARRRRAMQNSVEAAVIEMLGHRKTKFRPRAVGAFEPQKERDEFGVRPTREIVSAFFQWSLLYLEMAVILTPFAPLLPLYVAWVAWGILVQALVWVFDEHK